MKKTGNAQKSLHDLSAVTFLQDYLDNAESVVETATRFSQYGSEIGHDRPIADCKFSPDGEVLATCGMSLLLV